MLVKALLPTALMGIASTVMLSTFGSTPEAGAGSKMAALAMLQYEQAGGAALYLGPSDDVWVYPHAGNASRDEYLRVWGTDGSAVGNVGEDENFSYGFLRWDLSGFPKNARVAKAELVLNHAPDPEFTLEQVKANPLQVRPLIGTFSEQDWFYEKVEKVRPVGGANVVFGTGFPAVAKGTELPVVINLIEGPGDFKSYFESAVKSERPYLSLALTSVINPGELGRQAVYRVYSNNAPNKAMRPLLRISLERR